MKFLKAALAATAIAAFATSAQAQDSSTYINVGVQTFEFDTYNVVGRLGYNFSENFGVEGEASIGVIGTDEEFFGETVDISTPFSFGGYLVARYPVSDQFDFFGRVGYSSVKVKAEFDGESESESADGLAFGGGIQYNFDDASGLRLGYTSADFDGGNADVVDLSYVRKF